MRYRSILRKLLRTKKDITSCHIVISYHMNFISFKKQKKKTINFNFKIYFIILSIKHNHQNIYKQNHDSERRI